MRLCQRYAGSPLSSCLLHYIAVYHLRQANSTIVTDHVESLGFDICRVHALPSQIIFLYFGIGYFGRLVGDWLYRGWSVDWFCDAESGERSAVLMYNILSGLSTFASPSSASLW